MLEQGQIVFAKENVLIRAGDCVVTVLPRLGGKISSIAIGGRELLQLPLAPLATRTQTMSFDESDASGWDECLPSVAATKVTTSDGRDHVIPDHGDLWRVAWEIQERGPGDTPQPAGDHHRPEDSRFLRLRGECFSLPLALERTLALKETNGGWQLQLNYRLTNTGTIPAPWSWAAHPLFVAEPGDRIVLPDSIRTLRVEGSRATRLGEAGVSVEWPIAKLADGSKSDLSIAQSSNSEVGDKLFAGPLNDSESWCALERPSAGVRIRVHFDPVATPYLGLWICYGGWPERQGPKQTCVAIEPTTAPLDSLARTGSWSRELGPGHFSEWTMRVNFELI